MYLFPCSHGIGKGRLDSQHRSKNTVVMMTVLRFSYAKRLCQLDRDWLINRRSGPAIDPANFPSTGLAPRQPCVMIAKVRQYTRHPTHQLVQRQLYELV
jgi:hypothetical protein